MAKFGEGEFFFGDDMVRSGASGGALEVGADELPGFGGEGPLLEGTHDVVFFGAVSRIEVVGFRAPFVDSCAFELFDDEDGEFAA